MLPIAVVLGATAGISSLRVQADNRRVAQVLLARIEAGANRQVVEESAVLKIGVVSEGPNPTLQRALAELPDNLADLGIRIRKDRQRLQAVAADEPALEEVEGAMDSFQERIETQLELLQEHDFSQAYLFDRERVGPAFAALHDAVQKADDRYRQRAKEANSFAHLGTIFIVALSFLTLALIHFERNRRARLVTAAEQRGIKESEARFRSLVQNSADVIGIVEPDLRIRYFSPAINNLIGYAPGQLLGRSLLEFFPEEEGNQLQEALEGLTGEVGASVTIERCLLHRDGAPRYIELSVTNLLEDPSVEGIVLNARDTTERRSVERERSRLQKELEHQAFHDPLTDLANRALFKDRVDHALVRSARLDEKIAVLFIDLDDFKLINDSLGHEAGDALLVAVGQRLTDSLRASDTVARLGGDEFAVLIEDLSEFEDVQIVADRLMESLKSPFDLEGRRVLVSASVGMALSEGITDTTEDLLANADVAMYSAKAAGKGCGRTYRSELRRSLVQRIGMESDLQKAIDNSQLVLYYQPVVDVNGGGVTGVEALLRWDHPERGLIPPNEFIPLAEETGLILPIGEWVMNEACRQAVLWDATNIGAPSQHMSVNLSVKQFHQSDLVEQVARSLRQTGLEPARLVLEITESVLMRDAEAIEKLHKLKELGVRLAVDDFGTGYSSLSYLRRFPIDILKIDKSFVDGMGRGAEESALARAILQISENLLLDAIAEGVETRDQLDELRAAGCREAQGYLFSPPLAPAALEPVLRDGLRAEATTAGR